MIETGKEYRTKRGWAVSNLRAAGCRTFVGFASSPDDDIVYACNWSGENGACIGVAGRPGAKISDWHLIEVKPRIKRTIWLNVYPVASLGSTCHATRRSADGRAASDRIACIPVEIDCEEGEGL